MAAKTKQLILDSSAGAIPTRTHGLGIWGNKRKATGIRVDEKLYKQAKPVMLAYFGSTCRCIETYLAALLATAQQRRIVGASPANTSIDIGRIVIERNIRSRRKMVVEEETEAVETVLGCGFCGKPAVSVFRDGVTGIEKPACQFHANVLQDELKWVEVKG